MLFRNTDSPKRQSKQSCHHEFISDFHWDYDVVGLTSKDDSTVRKYGTVRSIFRQIARYACTVRNYC